MQIELFSYITPEGLEYRFNNDYDKFLLSFEGEGMPPINYITQTGPNQHGTTILDYRLQPRTIQWLHKKNACDRQGYWESRGVLLDMLRPNRSVMWCPGKLVYKLPGNVVRYIDVAIQQGPNFSPRSLDAYDEFSFLETLRFLAPDPTFYDPTLVIVTALAGLITDSLILPFTMPFVFMVGIISFSGAITYVGTFATYPKIILTGPLQGVTIYNSAIDKTIKLNYSISGGEVVTIDLTYGYKTVTSSTGANLIGSIDDASSLTLFRIESAPIAPGGVNTITIDAFGAIAGVSSVVLQYYTKYIGI